MRLSKKGIYALRVLRILAEHHGQGTLSAAQLAEADQIPHKFLEQILTLLRKRGYLVSTRGKEGGYALRIPPEEITLADIIRAIDGPLAPIPCASRTQPTKCTDCPDPYETCWLRLLMLRVRDNISAILDNETLANIVREARESKSGQLEVQGSGI